MEKALAAVDAIIGLMETEELRSTLLAEIQQMEEEGFEVIDYREKLAKPATKIQLVDVFRELEEVQRAVPHLDRFRYFEPNSLTEIQEARPPGPRAMQVKLSISDLSDRIYGGWLGRVAGCVLGKPVELPWTKAKLEAYLRLAGCYPLTDYVPRLSPLPPEYRLNSASQGNMLGEIQGALDDDDTDYTILALRILEQYGVDFTTANVASSWQKNLAYHRTWTAERLVYRNLVLGVPALEAAGVLNPYREYIGARIRADMYGFAAPGKPELAARLAYQDAALSHTKNGIYSAMFMAACIAAAFATNDMEKIVTTGLSEIPANCRLAEAICQTLAVRSKTADWESAYAHLLPEQAGYDMIHAINNTVWMVLALLYGEGDFERTVCTAVMCGYDTDCNGANAGAVVGTLLGASHLPDKWTAPLQDTLYSSVANFQETRISELARRTTTIAAQTLSPQ